MELQAIEAQKPAEPWTLKINRKTKIAPPCLGLFRPTVGQCCHQCTPESLRNKLEQNSLLGFRNILNISEKHTRYRGWLVRRMCCVLFVSGCKVFPSPVTNRVERVYQSNRVKEALAAEPQAEHGGDGQGQINCLATFLPLINTCISSGLLRFVGWLFLKMLASVFGTVQVNLNHLLALHKASQEGSPLVYVYVRQNALDCALIPLTLFCHGLRVPYTICSVKINNSLLRMILQKVGVVFLLNGDLTEQEFERDPLSSAVVTSLVRELLHERQAVSVAVSAEPGQGGQWLARIRQLIKDGSIPDVCLVPVGISYNCVPSADPQIGLSSVVKCLLSLLWTRSWGSVRIDLAQPFSLKEMCDSGRCRVDDWLPLQDLLLPVILNNRSESANGRRRMSWLLPFHYATGHKPLPQDDLSIAIILHLIYSTASCKSAMSTSVVSSLLLHKHHKGVKLSVLCRDVSWLTEELLFRNKDVGFGGTLSKMVHYSLSLLAPHLIMAAAPSRKDPLILPRPSPAAAHHLSLQAQTVTHAFILEAVGACAVSAMLSNVASSGVRSDAMAGDEVKGDMEFDVVLCQTELTNRALQLCHLLPPGFMPPCQSSQSFALDAVDSLVRCGILIMEEVPRGVPICDVWKREGAFSWTASDDPYNSDSDCEEFESRSYKITQPRQCPNLLFFLCSLLSDYLRSLCWATSALENLLSPLPEADFKTQMHCQLCDMARKKKMHYESCSEVAVHTALRTLIDLGVLLEEQEKGGVFLSVSPLFHSSENRQKLHRFISQYLYNYHV